MRTQKICFLACLWLVSIGTATSQTFTPFPDDITRQDTLRGSITPERAWWDLKYYDIELEVFWDTKSIAGVNHITYQVVKNSPGRLQIDLQSPMRITAVEQNGQSLSWEQEGDAWFIKLEAAQPLGSEMKLSVSWEGVPKVAVRPPWDGGFTWTQDSNGKPFIATANQGDGASLWWPCKDHPKDEPDQGTRMAVTVPQDLVQVGNGRLVGTKRNRREKTKTYTWEVVNPINSYGINLNIGDYVNFTETFDGEKGPLDCSYWVLRENETKAREQFKQARMTLQAFEHWFGPYPFYEDSYKLVEAPYLGMEHQSSVTYGNKYGNGYLGRDLSMTGEGMQFDFIIVHESGHEWFANSITNQDVADMWVHEGFTNYSESLFLEYHYGKESAFKYLRGLRSSIGNQGTVIGLYGVNREGTGDMYYKGSNMLHTIRMIMNEDEAWRNILRGLNKEFYHQTVTSKQVEDYINAATEVDLAPVFDQYLRDIRIPTFTYRIMANGMMMYKWSNVKSGFAMPLDVSIDGEAQRLMVTDQWQMLQEVSVAATVKTDPNFYIYQHNQTVGND